MASILAEIHPGTSERAAFLGDTVSVHFFHRARLRSGARPQVPLPDWTDAGT